MNNSIIHYFQLSFKFLPNRIHEDYELFFRTIKMLTCPFAKESKLELILSHIIDKVSLQDFLAELT